MTNHPTTELLSDELVSKVEAACNDGYSIAPGTGAALCQTVRALRAEISTLKGHWADTSEDLASAWEKHAELESENAALRERLAHVQRERNDLYEQNWPFEWQVATAEKKRREDVEFQLTQLTRERDDYRDQLVEAKAETVEAQASVESLSRVIFYGEQATWMRERCVEKMREVLRPYELEFRRKTNSATNIVDYVAMAIESLTLEGTKEQ